MLAVVGGCAIWLSYLSCTFFETHCPLLTFPCTRHRPRSSFRSKTTFFRALNRILHLKGYFSRLLHSAYRIQHSDLFETNWCVITVILLYILWDFSRFTLVRLWLCRPLFSKLVSYFLLSFLKKRGFYDMASRTQQYPQCTRPVSYGIKEREIWPDVLWDGDGLNCRGLGVLSCNRWSWSSEVGSMLNMYM